MALNAFLAKPLGSSVAISKSFISHHQYAQSLLTVLSLSYCISIFFKLLYVNTMPSSVLLIIFLLAPQDRYYAV